MEREKVKKCLYCGKNNGPQCEHKEVKGKAITVDLYPCEECKEDMDAHETVIMIKIPVMYESDFDSNLGVKVTSSKRFSEEGKIVMSYSEKDLKDGLGGILCEIDRQLVENITGRKQEGYPGIIVNAEYFRTIKTINEIVEELIVEEDETLSIEYQMNSISMLLCIRRDGETLKNVFLQVFDPETLEERLIIRDDDEAVLLFEAADAKSKDLAVIVKDILKDIVNNSTSEEIRHPKYDVNGVITMVQRASNFADLLREQDYSDK